MCAPHKRQDQSAIIGMSLEMPRATEASPLASAWAGPTEKSPLASDYPEPRPLKTWAAYVRDSLTNIFKARVGRCGLISMVLLFGVLICGLVMLALGLRAPQDATCRLDVSVEGLCVEAFSDYQLLDALNGRLPQTTAQSYLQSWPTSLATRYMADSAMYRGRANNTATPQASYPTLARLVQNEPVPSGSDSWCVVHVRVAGSDATRRADFARGDVAQLMVRHNFTQRACENGVHILASAAVPHCARASNGLMNSASPAAATAVAAMAESEAHVRAVRSEICARGYATTMLLGLTPDEIVALLCRSRAGLSLDPEMDGLVASVRAQHVRRR